MEQKDESKRKHRRKHRHHHPDEPCPPHVIGPGYDKDWEARLKKQLVGLGERLKKGDDSVVRRARRVPATATTGHALEPSLGACNGDLPYLTILDDQNDPFFDRFHWWTQDGTKHGVAVAVPATGFIDKQFECEFNRPLVTVVGGNPPSDPLPPGFDVLPWDAFASPNEVPGIQFTVRVQHFLPGEPTALEIATVAASTVCDAQNQPCRVVLNAGVPNVPPDQFPQGKFRSSLIFEFHVPQRAVGLEFGYRSLAESDRQPSAVGVILYAYDTQGQPITNSDAGRVGGPFRGGDEPLLHPDFVQHRVGVRDQAGNIRSVELRFESVHAHDHNGIRIVEEQVVYRVWHESLPPAVVVQDKIVREYGPDAAPFAPESIDLPYHCDRALVLLRGLQDGVPGRPHA